MTAIIVILVYMVMGCITWLIINKCKSNLGEDGTRYAFELVNGRLSDDEVYILSNILDMLSLYAWPFVWGVSIYVIIFYALHKD